MQWKKSHKNSSADLFCILKNQNNREKMRIVKLNTDMDSSLRWIFPRSRRIVSGVFTNTDFFFFFCKNLQNWNLAKFITESDNLKQTEHPPSSTTVDSHCNLSVT